MSVFVVRAFVKLREVLASTDELAKKLDDLERKLNVAPERSRKSHHATVCADTGPASTATASAGTKAAPYRILISG